jgi:cytoskeletal protein CcmA (bactofilin family)
MFTKKSEPSPLTSARPGLPPTPPKGDVQRPASGSVSQISADLTIIGNLISQGEVQVDGEVQGDIQAQRIVIGERARITGALIAEEVVVRGSVQGSIRGNAVTFQSSSRIEGDVFHKSLAIEQGAFFEGKSRRSEDPMSVQRAVTGVPPPG